MEENKLVIFEDDEIELKVSFDFIEGTVWLSQNQITELFGSSKANISEHIKNILTNELVEREVVRNFRATGKDKKRYSVKHYNLDMIISVGYGVNSIRGIKFRQ